MRIGRRRAPFRALCSLGYMMQLSRLVLLILGLIIGKTTASNIFSTARSASMSSMVLSSSSSRRFLWRTSNNPKKKNLLDVQPQLSSLLLLRGGSTAVLQQSEESSSSSTTSPSSAAPADHGADQELQQQQRQLQSYRLQQQLYLQSRSVQLRQALIQRGLDELQFTAKDPSATVVQEVDWDCALSTEEHPYPCLYTFDAEPGAKVVGPVNTTKDWITLTALNRLRRHDPTKVEPLWHSKHPILLTWFAPLSSSHPYSLYTHLSPVGSALALLLDAPWMLALVLGASLALGVLVTLPVWESLLQTALCSPFVWTHWPQWARFVHAALPLKLLLGQMAFKGVARAWGKLYAGIRTRLVEWECRILEECTPLTIVEGVEEKVEEEEEEEDGDYALDVDDDVEENEVYDDDDVDTEDD